jgi:hypothetical protein
LRFKPRAGNHLSREIIESRFISNRRSALSVSAKQIHGEVYVSDLMKMPHLLIADHKLRQERGINSMLAYLV